MGSGFNCNLDITRCFHEITNWRMEGGTPLGGGEHSSLRGRAPFMGGNSLGGGSVSSTGVVIVSSVSTTKG